MSPFTPAIELQTTLLMSFVAVTRESGVGWPLREPVNAQIRFKTYVSVVESIRTGFILMCTKLSGGGV